jgi:hypothetical protein
VTAMVMAADGLPPPAATLLLQLRYAGPRLLPSPCSQPPAAPSMSAASWGRPRPTSTPWRAQGGHGGRHPTNTKTRKSNSHLSKTRRLGECSLTSGWRSPASSSLGARQALWLQPTLPPPHPQSPPRRALAPQRHAQAPPRCAPLLSRAAW